MRDRRSRVNATVTVDGLSRAARGARGCSMAPTASQQALLLRLLGIRHPASWRRLSWISRLGRSHDVGRTDFLPDGYAAVREDTVTALPLWGRASSAQCLSEASQNGAAPLGKAALTAVVENPVTAFRGPQRPSDGSPRSPAVPSRRWTRPRRRRPMPHRRRLGAPLRGLR